MRDSIRISYLTLIICIVCLSNTYSQVHDIRFERISLEEGLSQSGVICILQDSLGYLWFGTGDGLNKYNGYGFEVMHHSPENLMSLSDDSITSIHEDHRGVLWVGTFSGGLNQFDQEKEIFQHWINEPGNPSSIGHDEVRSIYEDQSGKLWIGTFGGGLNQFDRKKGEFLRWKNKPGDPNSISTDQILSIYEDRAGILWIGTYAGGINRYDREKSKFMYWVHKPGDRNSLFNNYVYSIYEDHLGILWVGTGGGGLNRIATIDDNESPPHISHYQNKPDDPSSLSSNNVMSLLEDRSGTLWIGTANGLNRYDRGNKEFTRWIKHSETSQTLSNNSILTIHEDNAGDLWIGTREGLNKFEHEDETFSHWIHDPKNPHSISHDVVVSILEDRGGNLWIGTGGGGLNKFDRNKGTFTHWKNEPGNAHSLSSNEILSIYEDQYGRLWIGTMGGGLNKFNRKEESFTRYREDDGLPNDVTYGILEDDFGNLWLSTNKGISKFNLKTESFRNYDHRDGLQINEFNQGAYFNSNGRLYFGGINGFVSFVPESIKENQNIPPVLITTFKVFDKILKNDISGKEEFKLSYRNKYYTLEFVALDYRSPEKNQYAYKMEGIDKDWIYSGTRRLATYSNLPSGNYTFRAKGSNSDGFWNEEGVSLQITITPPFWKSWWFRIAAPIFLLGMVIMGHKLRLRNMETKKRRLEHTVRQRTDELEEKNRQLKTAFSALKDSQSQLAHSEKMAALGDLTAGVAHEVNTPVGALNSAADTSRRAIENIIDSLEESKDLSEILEDKKFRASLDIIKISNKIKIQASERIIKIVQSLKDFARLDMQEFQEADINEGIESTLSLLDHKFKSRISVVKKFEEIPKILCHPNQLNQVFMNIITNASEAIKDKGIITIKTSREKERIIVQISDNGVGIEDGNLEKIFNPGFTTRGVGIGTGLGLSISYRIIKAHKGDMDVRSELGKGTDFILTIPIKQPKNP